MINLQRIHTYLRPLFAMPGISLAALTLMLHKPLAMATDEELGDQYNIQLGAFFVTRTNAQIRLSETAAGPINIGTSIDWDRDLGGDTSMTAPRIDGFYRFTPKHRMDVSWYNIDRKGSIVAQRPIDFGDININIGDSIDSQFNTNTLKVAYTYSFYHAPEIETAVTVGLHVTRLEAVLSSTDFGISEKSSTTAPLPVFGFRLDYVLNPKWTVRSKYELFFLDRVEEYKGAFSDFSILFEHQTFKNVGFGFGMNRSSLTLEINDGDQRAQTDSVLNGFMLYMVVR